MRRTGLHDRLDAAGDRGFARRPRGNKMPTMILKPRRIEAAGNKPKLIDEYVGRVNSGQRDASPVTVKRRVTSRISTCLIRIAEICHYFACIMNLA